MLDIGTVLCYKTTGELCVVLGECGDERHITVRRPIMTKDGILQQIDTIYPEELETIEDHLRREAREMVIKVKIQNEIQKELQELDKDKPVTELVN